MGRVSDRFWARGEHSVGLGEFVERLESGERTAGDRRRFGVVGS